MHGRGHPFFNSGGPFSGFGGFEGHRNLVSSVFGGNDPFDDPFFTRPFGGLFGDPFPNHTPLGGLFDDPFLNRPPFGGLGSSFFGSNGSPMDQHRVGLIQQQPPQPARSTGPIIEELNSDDEKESEENEEKKDNPRKHGRSTEEPLVEDPDDESEARKSKQMVYENDFNSMHNRRAQSKPHSFTFQSSTVTYGGPSGAYYTASTSRRAGSDGLSFEERKEANSATGQAAHRISRGIHDKGHSVARKLNSDGRVDTMQTLHNINEDEIAGFEDTWRGKAEKSLPGWGERFIAHNSIGSGSSAENGPSRGGWALPSNEKFQQPTGPGVQEMASGLSHPQRSGPPPSRIRSKLAGTVNSDKNKKR